MNRKVLIAIIGIIALLVTSIPFLINLYNSYAEKQRESIKYCETDDDCIVQSYHSEFCGSWSGCFNKNEKPLSDIGSRKAICEFPPGSCKCKDGKCVSGISSH